jgi:hypothetical protein
MRTSSNYALRLPASLKRAVEEVAREDGTTLNQFIVSAVAEKLAALRTADYFAKRALLVLILPPSIVSCESVAAKLHGQTMRFQRAIARRSPQAGVGLRRQSGYRGWKALGLGTITARQRDRECVAREPLNFRNRLL